MKGRPAGNRTPSEVIVCGDNKSIIASRRKVGNFANWHGMTITALPYLFHNRQEFHDDASNLDRLAHYMQLRPGDVERGGGYPREVLDALIRLRRALELEAA